jgi:hypothetical protein
MSPYELLKGEKVFVSLSIFICDSLNLEVVSPFQG